MLKKMKPAVINEAQQGKPSTKWDCQEAKHMGQWSISQIPPKSVQGGCIEVSRILSHGTIFDSMNTRI